MSCHLKNRNRWFGFLNQVFISFAFFRFESFGQDSVTAGVFFTTLATHPNTNNMLHLDKSDRWISHKQIQMNIMSNAPKGEKTHQQINCER